MSQTNAAAEQHAMIGVGSDFVKQGAAAPSTFQPNRRPGTQWFADAGLGLFLHWTTSSVHARTDASWGMIIGTNYDADVKGEVSPYKMPPNEYFAHAEKFNPQNYDPDSWIKLAAESGFRYAVLTTKHHEGYTLWPSEYGDFGTRTHLGGRDLVRPFVEACRRHGLKVGLYFSPPDWHYNRHQMSFHYRSEMTPGKTHLGLDHEPIELPVRPPGWEEGFHRMVRGQIIELLTRYGQIDQLWFDGKPEVISFDEIRAIQPDILVNSRMHGYGDFETPECRLPETTPASWWELADTSDKSGRWGFFYRDTYASNAEILFRFAKTRSLGGNYLINVAPNSEGQLPPEAVHLLRGFGDFNRVHGDAVFGIDRITGLYPAKSPVPDTRRGSMHYLLVPAEYTENHILIQADWNPREVWFNSPAQPLEYQVEKEGLRIPLPPNRTKDSLDVIGVELSAE